MVEEAGEVFEPHILACLAPTVEQLILIGDHEQLRPKPQLYALQASAERHKVLLSCTPTLSQLHHIDLHCNACTTAVHLPHTDTEATPCVSYVLDSPLLFLGVASNALSLRCLQQS